MNKLSILALLAGSLLLLDAPEAAAHKGAYVVSPPPAWFRYEAGRPQQMPRWLHRNKSFRSWYQRSPLKRNRYIAWQHLYEIWYWEKAVAKRYRHKHRHDRGYDDSYHSRGHQHRGERGHRH
jgi:hypothetical protein